MATIKFTYAGMTRRAVFSDEHPSWTDLSHRAETMFEIPASSVAVSYIDPDGDTMYITSNDELFDYFHTETSQPQKPVVHRFTVYDRRQNQSRSPDDFEHVPPSTRQDDDSSSASSESSSDLETSALPNLGDRGPSRSMGIGGMGIGFAPFEMMFGPAASAANAKSPSQGHISPVPTDPAMLAAEAGRAGSHYGRSVASTSVRSESVIGDADGNPSIHIQQATNDSMSEAEADPVTPSATMHPLHPTPALYHDVSNFVHALSGAVAAHPEVSNSLLHLTMNAQSGIYWDSLPPVPEVQQASTHHLLNAIDSLLHTFFPPPPPRTPTQPAHLATPAYTAAGFELPASIMGDETPVPSRLHTPAQVPVPMVASPAMTASSIPTVHGPAIRPVLDMARADRSSVRSDTDAGSIVSGMGSPLRGNGPAWRFAGRTGGSNTGASTPTMGMIGGPAGGAWKGYTGLNTQTGAMVPVPQPDTPEAAKYVESRVRLEHMKEMYKQTKEEYRREREERKREREQKKRERLLGPPPEAVAPPPPPPGDMFERLNAALNDIPGRTSARHDGGRVGMIPPAPASVGESVHTNETAIRNRTQLNNWLTEQLGDMGFSSSTHPQVGKLVREATRPYASNAEAADENALLEELLAQLVPTSSKV